MTIDTPEFRSLFSPELNALADIFHRHSFELRIAGGAVRDLLMGMRPVDIDFATTATPDQMKGMFESAGIRMINNRGEKHGTVTCRMNDKDNFEITTLRIDVLCTGRHAEVQFTTNWELDANRRDLTINSMFLGLDGTVYDFFSGIEDIERRRVRFVGNPTERIQEDYLRILRYFRFFGRIAVEGQSHEEATLQAIRENAEGLAGISGERIWTELKKIIVGKQAGSLLTVMHQLGLFRVDLLGLHEDADLEEFKLVYDRCRDHSPQTMTLCVAMLASEAEVLELEKRVRCSAEERKTALLVVEHRHRPLDEVNPLKPYKDLTIDLGPAEGAKVKQRVAEILKYQGHVHLLEEFEEWKVPKMPVSGHMILAKGLPKGPKLKPVLDELREIWKKSDFTLTADELLDRLPEVAEKLHLKLDPK